MARSCRERVKNTINTIPMNEDYKFCPYCGESIRKAAIKCRYCRNWLSQPSAEQQSPAGQDLELLRRNAAHAAREFAGNRQVQAVSGKISSLSSKDALLLYCGMGLLIVLLFLFLPMWNFGGFGSFGGYKCFTEDNLGSLYPLLPILFVSGTIFAIAWTFMKKQINWIFTGSAAILCILTIVMVPMIQVHLCGYLVMLLCLGWVAVALILKNKTLSC